MKLGIDVGSTTVKLVLFSDSNEILYKKYERHMSNVFGKVSELLLELNKEYSSENIKVVITGSGGLALSELIGVKFEQEVISCSRAVEELIPQTDVAIELGGEDAKITFYGNTVEQQMNGTCAGGTGAFIDQMAVLLNTDASGLNEAAKNYKIIYPIAARCGVFAKTDIQPLINEGAAVEDLAASIFQAVVNQTISGLACGRKITGNIAFLGGPLSFLSELKARFVETLNIPEENIISPEDGKYFVAIGAAYLAEDVDETPLSELIDRLNNVNLDSLNDTKHIEPMFKTQADFDEFIERHNKEKITRKGIKDARGNVYLGIDAGSTTTKAALIDDDKKLLFEFYKSNEGQTLETVKQLLIELYTQLPEEAHIANACVTGYGEGLIKAAYKVDLGEIETMAHYKGAEEFLPGVDFILDIGGQDMKCMKIKNGAIHSIMLNEACSSGCGSFLETYAKSVEMDAKSFGKEALESKSPVDLGTRCTVFMNSKVKQAQKEGATIADISAGLSFSVIKNALYKVIKLRDISEVGDKIVVQGGTFLNNAVLRAMEQIVGRNVVRPDVAGIMGAFGAAIIARERNVEGHISTIAKKDELDHFEVKNTHARCGLCENNCLLTINQFKDGSRFVTGNRCERGEGKKVEKNTLMDLFEYKYKKIFNYTPITENETTRGTIGIPRVLNMYENYPFWFTLFTTLGYSVKLSPHSSKNLYEKGMDTIASDTACYPAKLVHGHIKSLVEDGIKYIFYPSINYEYIEDNKASNHYNCPIVGTYAESIAKNMDDVFNDNDVVFMNPFLPYDNDKRLAEQLYKYLPSIFVNQKFTKIEISNAVELARKEYKNVKLDIQQKGEEAIEFARLNNKKAIVLAGRPYHIDPEINHGINKLITQFDFVVLTEDSVSHLGKLKRPIRVLDQWMYHSRLYKATEFVGNTDDIEIIQLNSFGCGLDAVTTDQVQEICDVHNKLYTVLKIDEGNNLGAAKIRIRSLKAALQERDKNDIKHIECEYETSREIFTEDMKKDYTIIIPQMAPMHFQFFETALAADGYKAKMLPSVNVHAVEEGLRYINNDACYPTIVSLGQIIAELKSGNQDLNKTAIIMSQTGGMCRASNYVSLLRKALKDLGMQQIPVISVSPSGIEKNPGFSFSRKLLVRMVLAIFYGDLFMKLVYKTRPYEVVAGSVNELFEKWSAVADENIKNGNIKIFKKNVNDIVNAFDEVAIDENLQKPKVGVVGEILVKYHPTANNDIVGLIESEGGEAVVLDLLDFFLYGMFNHNFNYEQLAGNRKTKLVNNIIIKIIDILKKPVNKALTHSKRFSASAHISETADKASEILSLGNQSGEGWLLTGEMVELLDSGVENIVCLQPFACLPNHITGKGMIKALKKRNPYANITAIDYDPGASTVNQFNRIKLMMSTAHKNLKEKAEIKK
ncbi:MAG: acyl-CoA dehydratase activase-related protein [Eubacteriales bacterium]|nr:acyl-CoA dehydratase activase-related protein [Eubacteriales bacterium]MDY3332615.1 acyl-CoA dehydratase activase-related protein [Gallibacter sp.]